MIKQKKLITIVLVLIIIASLIIGCSKPTEHDSVDLGEFDIEQWEGIKLTLGTINPEHNPDSLAAKWFSDKLREKTNGKLDIDVYSDSQLGNQNAQIESLMMGTQDFFIGGIEPFSNIATELRALNVYFSFENQDQFQKFFNSKWYDTAKEKLASNNIVSVNKKMNWVKGPFRIILSTKEISGDISSVKGLTIRIPDQETFQKSCTALGMTPIVVALNETYLALQQGLVDAVDLIPASIKSNGFHEIIKYVLKTDAFPQREGVMMSKSAFDGLPENIQQLIYETADEAGEYYSELVIKESDNILQEIQDMGIVYIDDADLSEWYESCKDLGYEFEKSGYLPNGMTDDIKAMK